MIIGEGWSPKGRLGCSRKAVNFRGLEMFWGSVGGGHRRRAERWLGACPLE